MSALFTRDGRLVASTAQEGMLRVRPESLKKQGVQPVSDQTLVKRTKPSDL